MTRARSALAVLVATTAAVAPASVCAKAGDPAKISHLEFNCDLERCGRPEEYQRFLSLTDLWVGRAYSEEAVDRAVHNLMKTGFFDRVEPFVEEDRLGVSVTLDTVGAIVVRNIHIEADWTILESDIRRRLAYRLGSRLKMGEVDVGRQKQSILKFLAKRGYHGGTVDIDFDIRGHEATVRVTIDVGHFYTIDTIQPQGNEHVSDFWFAVYFRQPRRFGLSSLYLQETLSAAKEDLLERYHDAGFYAARITLQEAIREKERLVDLTVVVKEGQQTRVFFEGNDVIADHELEELLTFHESRSADQTEIDRTVVRLRAAYQSRGYHHATIKPYVIKTGDPLVEDLVFDIYEGTVARVETIRFLGNKAFTDHQLSEIVQTKTFAVLSGQPGFALDAQLTEDLSSLVSHYVEHGFLRAKAEVARVESRQNGEYLTVVYRVSEGPRTMINEVQVHGVRRYPRETVLETMNLQPGDAYGPRRVLEAVAALQSRYRADGHPHAKIRHDCSLPNGKVQPCDVLFVAAGRSVRVQVRVTEGPRVTVGEIFIRGNFVTDEDTLRNEMPLKSGAPFEYSKLLEGQSNIRSLRLFRSVRADLIGFAKGEERDRVGVVVVVEERDYLFAEFALGFQTVSRAAQTNAEIELGLYGEASFVNQNVFGWGKQVALPLRLGNLETSLTPTFTDPRVFGTRTRMDLSLNFAATNDLDAQYVVIPLEVQRFFDGRPLAEAYNRFELGTAVQFKRDFSRVTRGTLELGLDRVIRRISEVTTHRRWVAQVSVPDDTLKQFEHVYEWTEQADAAGSPAGEVLVTRVARVPGPYVITYTPDDKRFQEPTADQPDATRNLCLFGGQPSQCLGDRQTTLRLSPGLVHDRRDSPLHPTRGYLIQSKVTFGTILKGLDPLGNTFAEDQFIRTTAGAQSYRSFIGSRLILANSFRLGLGFPLGTEDRLPPDDLSVLGGATTVRGLPDGGVQTPRNNKLGNTESGGNHSAVFNVELRGRLWWWIWAVLFYDAGVLVDSFDEVGDKLALRQSLGFGLRWLILDQIPVRMDVAFPLALAPGEVAVPFHVAIGYPF